MSINSNLKPELHLSNRRKCLNTAISRLTSLGLTSENFHAFTKAQLLKIYIRPVLAYGIENIELDKKNLLTLKRLEENNLKRMLQISNRCHSTELYEALNIEAATNYLTRSKLTFCLRLWNNEFTKNHMPDKR